MRRLLLGLVGLFVLSIPGMVRSGPPASSAKGLTSLVRLLAESSDPELQLDVLKGIQEAFQGRRQIKPPEGWPDAKRRLSDSPNADVRQKALLLSVLFGDQEALTTLRQTAGNPRAKTVERQAALQMMMDVQAEGLLPLLRELIADRAMCGIALRGLAAFNDPATPALILRHYPMLEESAKADAVQTLAARPSFALALLEGMEKGIVARRDLSAFTARQLFGFKDKRLTEKLNAVWGSIRPASQDKTALLARYKSLVPPDALQKADRSKGRIVYTKTCANCHVLFNEGGKIGPELTGAQRTNPEYILTKVLDPNAVVARDYQVTVIETINGRVLNGIIKSENDKVVTVQTLNEIITLPVADIQERRKSTTSMMPEGQLAQLSDAEIRDLIAYLAGPSQAPLPQATPGKDGLPKKQ